MNHMNSFAERKKLLPLQTLRFFAFVMIFLNHSYDTRHLWTPDFGARGVEIFFVMSGFLMVYQYWQNPRRLISYNLKSCWDMTYQKLKKFYVLHLITFLIAAISVWNGIRRHGFPIDEMISNALAIPLHVLLLQSWLNFSAWKYNGVAWFLSTIMACYFLMPYVLKLLDTLHSRKNLCILILLTLLIKWGFPHLGAYIHGFNFGFFNYVNPIARFWDFLLGCAVGALFLKNLKVQDNWSCSVISILQISSIFLYIGAVILGGGAQQRGHWSPVIFLMLSSFLIYALSLSGGVLQKTLSNPMLVYLGNISFECYIIHTIILNWVHKLPLGNKSWIILSFIIIIALGNWLHHKLFGGSFQYSDGKMFRL